MSQRVELTGRAPIVCMVCAITYAIKPCLPEQDGLLSHGCCPACFPAAMAQIERELTFSCRPRSNDETQSVSSILRSA